VNHGRLRARHVTCVRAGQNRRAYDLLSSRSRVRVALGAPPLHRRSDHVPPHTLMIFTTRPAAFVPVACPMGEACGASVRAR
jgi:hypothetical protein